MPVSARVTSLSVPVMAVMLQESVLRKHMHWFDCLSCYYDEDGSWTWWNLEFGTLTPRANRRENGKPKKEGNGILPSSTTSIRKFVPPTGTLVSAYGPPISGGNGHQPVDPHDNSLKFPFLHCSVHHSLTPWYGSQSTYQISGAPYRRDFEG